MELDLGMVGLITRIGIILFGLVVALIVIGLRRRKRLPVARLTVLDSEAPELINKEYLIMGYPATLGRDRENAVSLHPDDTVSRFHARLECLEGQVVLREVLIRDSDGKIRGSTNGTFVDSRKVDSQAAPVELRAGSTIRLGSRLTLRFEEVVIPSSNYVGTRQEIKVPEDLTRDRSEP
jgi:hypothetical protein